MQALDEVACDALRIRLVEEVGAGQITVPPEFGGSSESECGTEGRTERSNQFHAMPFGHVS